MMAMTLKQETTQEDDDAEEEPGFERASNAFRATTTTTTNGGNTNDSSGGGGNGSVSAMEKKMRRHSGLSALIEAATTQLGQLEEEHTVVGSSDNNNSINSSNHVGGVETAKSVFNSSNNIDEKTPSTNTAVVGGGLRGSSTKAATIPPRHYTPHGFHTSITSTITTTPSNDDVITGPSLLPGKSTQPSLLTTPPLGPEAVSGSDVRKQTFPEILMTILEDKTNEDVITFLPDGKYFAIRRKEFSETTMMNYFSIASFDEFLEKIHSWGFSRIIDQRGSGGSGNNGSDGSSSGHQQPFRFGVEIFRHPMFVKGDWEKCSRICFGESPTNVRLSALPDRARIEYTLSDEATLSSSKRRLSPSHVKKESETESSLSKQRISSSADKPPLHHTSSNISENGEHPQQIPAISKSESVDTASTDASANNSSNIHNNENSSASNGHYNHQHQQQLEDSLMRTSRSNSVISTTAEDDVRSLALAITTEKLNLKTPDDVEEHVKDGTPLVERAVENATHTIVTDAIETLLRDECHSRETYRKHERELSRSSLPGVVPISKQLFSTSNESSLGGGSEGNWMRPQQQQQQQQQNPSGITAAEVEAARALSFQCKRGPLNDERNGDTHSKNEVASMLPEGTIPQKKEPAEKDQRPAGLTPTKEEGNDGVAVAMSISSRST